MKTLDAISAQPVRHSFPVESPETANARISALRDRYRDLGLQPIHFDPAVANTYSLAQWQTPVKSQGDRGSCWAFAAAGALEAAYKRGYFLELDLAEEYILSVERTAECLTGVVETNTCYTDNGGGSDVISVMPAYGVPLEGYAPYFQYRAALVALVQALVPSGKGLLDASNQEAIDAFELSEKHIPTAARRNASYRITSWAFLDGSIAAIEAAIAANHEVLINLTVGKNPTSKNPLENNSNVGSHTTLVIGYDRTNRNFLVKNSWGGSGFTQLSYDYYSKFGSNAAHVITGVADPGSPADATAPWRGEWYMDHDGWRGRLVIRRTFNFEHYVAKINDTAAALAAGADAVRLGSYYRDGIRHDVNGQITGGRMTFYIADGSAHIDSGTKQGQRFDVSLMSRDMNTAAGVTSWNNQPFGVVLSREEIPGLAATFKPQDWMGSWVMAHDGWYGTLIVFGVHAPATDRNMPVMVRYRTADGHELPAMASIGTASNPSLGYAVTVTITFSPQNHQVFQLFAHTREAGVFSGTTQLGGAVYGVRGLKVRPIYAVERNGTLLWYMHTGRLERRFDWSGPASVGTGWQDFKWVLAGGDGVIYAIEKGGLLRWYRHLGNFDGVTGFTHSTVVGSGWENFATVFSGGAGVLYAIQSNGDLLWYRHDGRASGTANWTGPVKVDTGWDQFQNVFSAGDGVIYGVLPDGTLRWHRHFGHQSGDLTWAKPTVVGGGWGNFVGLFAGEFGTVYAIQKDGILLEYTHQGYLEGANRWLGPVNVGGGWQNFNQTFCS